VFCTDLTRKDDHYLKLRKAAGLNVYDYLVPGYILIIVQQNATQSSLCIFLQVHSTYFRFQPHPSSGVHKTVTTASGIAATSLQRGQAWPRWREVGAQKIWPVPEAVVTVLCTADDGCGWHPKHVEWTCRLIYGLFCVASRWTIINIDQRCTGP